MEKTIYGIDPSQKLTPFMVRDAIVECFFQAHCAAAGINKDEKETNRQYCKDIVSKAFFDAGEDFNNPTKMGIMNAMEKLAEFANKFRDPKVIEKHYNEVLQLVKKL